MLTDEEKREYNRKYYLANKEKLRVQHRENYYKNKDTYRERTAQWTAANKDYVAEYQRVKSRENSVSGYSALQNIKSRCRKNNLPFNLTKEYTDAITPTHCPVLGYELVRNVGGGSPAYNSISIDRIVPSKGYIIGNVQIISHKANSMKQNATPEELLMFANWILNTQKELTC
jgi:hypothetical protein